MLIHADNWSCCNYYDFVSFHEKQRPEYCAMTMMVFETPVPKSCGIVELDGNGVVVKFHEKVDNPPGNRANAAVYILEPEVIDWINDNPDVTDFSVHVIKEYLGKIATWKNDGIHKDIGTIEMLLDAQTDFCQPLYNEDIKDNWQSRFDQHPIHGMITKYS